MSTIKFCYMRILDRPCLNSSISHPYSEKKRREIAVLPVKKMLETMFDLDFTHYYINNYVLTEISFLYSTFHSSIQCANYRESCTCGRVWYTSFRTSLAPEEGNGFNASKEEPMKKLFVRVAWCLVILSGLSVVSCASAGPLSDGSQEPAASASSDRLIPVVSGRFTTTSKYGNNDTDIPVQAMYNAGFELGDICTIMIGDFSYDAPFVNSYGDVEPGNYLFHPHHDWIEFAICNGNFSKTHGFGEGDSVTISMKEKAGYLTQYEIRNIVKSENRDDYASDTIFANVRTIQLGSIGFHKLYRSCNPILNDARGPYAAELLSNMGIKTIINLADKQEDLAAMSAAALNAQWYSQIVETGDAIGLNMGISFFDDEFVSLLKQALLFMVAHEGPYLFHCNEGRDRAGYFAALLEALMGASVNEIYADYMASFDNYFGIKEGTAKYDAYRKIQVDQMSVVNGGLPMTDENASAAAEQYLIETVGLTAEQVSTLKANLL